MRRILTALALGALSVIPVMMLGQTREVTFSKDVAPILNENCVYCHRPGEIASFSMMTYKDARPWAKAIKQEVLARRMPPWFADPHVSAFRNDKRLSERDIQTLAAWADGGAKEGNPAELPPPPQFADGWQIGTPDLVVTMAKPYKVAATGTIPYVTLPTDYVFPEDTWVQAIEVRPGNRKVVHHAFAVLGTGGVANGLHLYSPGLEAMIFRDGYGKLIPKGTRIGLQMHYNAIGQETTDQSRVGFKFATKPVHTEVRTEMVMNSAFSIPPMTQSHEIIAAFPLPVDARIHALRPHMHVRGKNASATLVLPDGKRKPLISMPVWNDYWQYYYVLAKPENAPKGSFIEYVATYDNSPANPLNPDPKSSVQFGQQVWEEMHLLYVNWTAVNDSNRNDLEPIQIPPNKLFTTGVAASRTAALPAR